MYCVIMTYSWVKTFVDDMASTSYKFNETSIPKYTLREFKKDFPNTETCLEWLKDRLYPDGIFCKVCDKVTSHYLIESRKSYSCQECGHHVHPTANTIFHKSRTPLNVWFYVIYRLASTKGGISAKQIERETGVTYKTAWRMCDLIRTQLNNNEWIK